MRPIDERMLRMYRERLGPLTADGALELALQADEIARIPGDPAAEHFAQRKEEFERYAYLLDMEAQAKKEPK